MASIESAIARHEQGGCRNGKAEKDYDGFLKVFVGLFIFFRSISRWALVCAIPRPVR